MFRRLLAQLWFIVAVVFAFGSHAQERQPEYQLGAGDNIRITVFQNPDLTVETRVTENGSISYPLVGSVTVGGMTIPVAEQAIARALREGRFLRQPQVNISLLQNRGNQVAVLGMVTRPGRFPLETVNTRLSEILAIAGGITAGGADIAILTGVREGKPLRREIDIPGIFLDGKLENDIVVTGGDVIYVHRQPMYYIYGEVQRPGSYRVERGMTMRQALAQAGGLSARGTERGMGVYRRDRAGRIEVSGVELSNPVIPDDVIYVRESLF